jgi:hypothetical protein
MNYADHYYRLGSVIRNTVSQAQDTLARIRVHQRPALIRRIFPSADKPWPIYGYPPVQYPKSLGELCIELAQNKILDKVGWYTDWGFLTPPEKLYVYPDFRRDIQELRTKMWHKHIDPKQERLYQLIDKIRTA